MEYGYEIEVWDVEKREKVKAKFYDGKDKPTSDNFFDYLMQLDREEGINEKTIKEFADFFRIGESFANAVVKKFLDYTLIRI